MKKILAKILSHKIIFLCLLIIISGGAYWGFKQYNSIESTASQYTLTTAENDTIIISVSGSGQISATNQVELKPKVSGDLVSLNIVNGQEIKSGDIIARIDSRDAQKAVRDARSSLENAKLSLAKILEPDDELSILQAENAITVAEENKLKAEINLENSYEDGYNTVADVFLDLPTVMTEIEQMFLKSTIDSSTSNIDWYLNQAIFASLDNQNLKAVQYRDDLNRQYESARIKFDQNYSNYKQITRYSSKDEMEEIINESYETTRVISDMVKTAKNYADYVADQLTKDGQAVPSTIASDQSDLDSYTKTVNQHLVSLLNTKQSFDELRDSIASAERTIEEKNISLEKLKVAADELDVKTQQLAIRQRQDALNDALEELADYSVKAPFDGVIADVAVNNKDTVTSGTTLATLITKQKIAEITLNEVDLVQVKVGQKATLTFDAVSDLTISGTVAQIDTLATASQGVVNYTVKIAFDTDDDRIRPGMSVTASIITEIKQDVLAVPNSAVKTNTQGSYVEIFDDTLTATATNNLLTTTEKPKQQSVVIGLANDSLTEIVSGLKAGDLVVSRTVSQSSSSNTNSSSGQNRSILQTVGGGGQRGNDMPIPH